FEYHLAELARRGDMPDLIVDLRPTSPLRRAHRISEGITMLIAAGLHGADSVRAVTEAAKHPYKMWRMEGARLFPLFNPADIGIAEPYDACRQDLPRVHQNNGAMYALWPRTILEKKSLTGTSILGYKMDDWESVNIDTELDFLLAEELMKRHPDE
ncbi:MAG: hypothetical protein WBK28_02875, partial [Minisyncoccia bacterium]